MFHLRIYRSVLQVSLALLGIATGSAVSANSVDLRRLVIPAAACIEASRSTGLSTSNAGFDANDGYFFLKGINGEQRNSDPSLPAAFCKIRSVEHRKPAYVISCVCR